MNRFPFGPAPTLLLLILIGMAVALALWPSEDVPASGEIHLHMATFAQTHLDSYKKVIPEFEASHPGVRVDIELVNSRALFERMQASFWADLDAPDLSEIEISSVGMFFRGPLDEVGFMDLTDRLHSTGLYDHIVESRFAPWSSRGRVFGLPHDVHPVMIAYRRDLFEEEGIDANNLDTWDKFIEAGRRVTRDVDGDGVIDRYMIELSDVDYGALEPLLFQRGGGFFDATGNLTMDNDVAVDVLAWYVPLVAGPERIANTLGAGQILTQAIEDGYLLCMICPDWRSKVTEVDMPRLKGKMALMPLPAFEPGGRRTSTWGGTMLAITKKTEYPDLAWELAMALYYDKGPFDQRFRENNILPPLRDAWTLPAISEPREYWSGQRIGELFASLADDTPPQHTSPYSFIAKTKMGEALLDCVQYYKQHGKVGFREYVAAVLKKKADDVRLIMGRNPFL